MHTVAANDTYSVSESDVLTVAASGLLANDVDPEGNAITATLVAEPLHGTVVLNADGSFVYTPTAATADPIVSHTLPQTVSRTQRSRRWPLKSAINHARLPETTTIPWPKTVFSALMHRES